MSLSQIINYNNLSNFTISPADTVETDGSKFSLKDQTPLNILCAATFELNKDLEPYSLGARTITLDGGAAIASGLLDLTGVGSKIASWVMTGQSPIQEGCIRLKYIPNYSGNPAAAQRILNCGTSSFNSILISHESSGALTFWVKSSSGADIFNDTVSFSPTAGHTYEIELNFNATTGIVTAYIDGTRVLNLTGKTGTRTSNCDDGFLGRYYGAGINSNFYIEEFSIYSIVKHTDAAYVVDSIPTGVYSTENPSILVNSGVLSDGLESLSGVFAFVGSDAVKFVVNLDGTDYWYDGATWAVSSGYAQSNLVADINTNIATLDLTPYATAKVKAYLHSDDGTTTPDITSMTIGYNFAAVPTYPNVCTCYGFITDASGAPLEGAVITFLMPDFYSGMNLVSKDVKTVSAANGFYEVDLVRTADDGIEVTQLVSYTDVDGNTAEFESKIIVPNQDTAAISDILV